MMKKLINNFYDRKKILLISIVIICFAFSGQAQADITQDIYSEISMKYPEEIKTLKRYGATDAKIKDFITAFNDILTNSTTLTEKNFEQEATDALMDLLFSGDHISFFDAVFNGWNLKLNSLLDALDKEGIEGVMNMLPESFQEIGRIVKKSIFPSSDLNNDGKVDLFDLLIISRCYGVFSNNPRYKSWMDFNHDEKIDMADLKYAAANYGRKM